MKIVKSSDLAEDFVPVCPHCDQALGTIIRINDHKDWLESDLGYCYACPHCRKILGFSDFSSS